MLQRDEEDHSHDNAPNLQSNKAASPKTDICQISHDIVCDDER
jgi:hypothetical protein